MLKIADMWKLLTLKHELNVSVESPHLYALLILHAHIDHAYFADSLGKLSH